MFRPGSRGIINTEPHKNEGAEGSVDGSGSSTAPVSTTAQTGLAAFIIAALAVGVYLNSFSTPWLELVRELLVESGTFDSIEAAWTVDGRYSPLASLIYAGLDGSESAYRVLAVLAHAVSAVLVFLLVQSFFRSAPTQAVPMLSGVLFAVHPIATVLVNDPLRLDGILATGLSLAALICGLRATWTTGRAALWLCTGLSCFALAWAASPTAWTIPIVLALAAWAAPRETFDAIRTRDTMIVYLAVLVLLFSLSGSLGCGADVGSLLVQSATFHSALLYAALPFGAALSSYHPEVESGFSIGYVAAALLVVVGVGLYRRMPVAGLGLIWFLLTYLAHGLYTTEAAFDPAALYAALPGLFLIVPLAFGPLHAAPGRALAGGAAVLIVLVCTALTVTRNSVWSNPGSYWASARTACPECPEPALYLARHQMEHALSPSQSVVTTPDTNRMSDIRMELDGIAEVLSRFASKVDDPAPYIRTWIDARVQLSRLDPRSDPARDRADILDELLDAVDRYPDDAALMMQTGAVLLTADPASSAAASASASNWRAALPYFHGAYRLAPNEDTRMALFEVSMGAGDIQTASQLLELLAATELPERTRQQAAAAQSLSQAAALLSQRLETATTGQERVVFQAQQSILLQRFRSASYQLEELMRTGNATGEVWTLLAIAYGRQGQFENFSRLWPPGAAHVPADANWESLARETARRGEWPLGHTALMQITDYRDDPVAAGEALVEISRELGSPQYANAVLARLTQTHPEDPRPWLALADLSSAPGSTAPPAQIAQFLERAAALGASEEEIEARREKVTLPEQPVSTGIERTIIE